MLQRLRSRMHGEDGFTLIELLVVILIIGILAAIAIPSFLNQKGKGEDTAAKSGARTAQTAMETFYTDNNNYNCGLDDAACDPKLRAIEQQLPADGDMTITPGTTGYSVEVTSNPSGRKFKITKDATTGVISHTCSVPNNQNNGGCKDPASTTAGW